MGFALEGPEDVNGLENGWATPADVAAGGESRAGVASGEVLTEVEEKGWNWDEGRRADALRRQLRQIIVVMGLGGFGERLI